MKMRISGTERGFTLVELLAVLAIIALAAVAFTANGSSGVGTAKVRALLVATAAAMGDARGIAMREGKEQIFVVDVPRRRVGALTLPPGVDLKATVAADERSADGKAGIRFFPGGTSSGGKLLFSYRGKTHEISVNWLTGHVSLQPV
jgi:general secretion pathway protein H